MFHSREPKPASGASDDHRTCKREVGPCAAALPLPWRPHRDEALESSASGLSAAPIKPLVRPAAEATCLIMDRREASAG